MASSTSLSAPSPLDATPSEREPSPPEIISLNGVNSRSELEEADEERVCKVGTLRDGRGLDGTAGRLDAVELG